MNTPTVYISAALLEVEYAAAIRDELAKLGIPCTSTWIDATLKQSPPPTDPAGEAERAAILAQNVDDIARCTAVVFLANVGAPRAGHWDACWALATGKLVFWVQSTSGRGRSIWDAHASVLRIPEGINPRQCAIKLAAAINRQFNPKARVA